MCLNEHMWTAEVAIATRHTYVRVSVSECVCPLDRDVWNNSVLCLPLSYFSSSALPVSKFHWCVHSVMEGLSPVVNPHPAKIGNTASLFHFLPHFSPLIQIYVFLFGALTHWTWLFVLEKGCSFAHALCCFFKHRVCAAIGQTPPLL